METETELIADCHGETEVKILQHVLFFTVTIESRTKVRGGDRHQCRSVSECVENEQKHIRRWYEAIEKEMNLMQNKAYHKLSVVRYLMAPPVQEPIDNTLCGRGCEKHEDFSRSTLLRTKFFETCKHFRKTCQVAV